MIAFSLGYLEGSTCGFLKVLKEKLNAFWTAKKLDFHCVCTVLIFLWLSSPLCVYVDANTFVSANEALQTTFTAGGLASFTVSIRLSKWNWKPIWSLLAEDGMRKWRQKLTQLFQENYNADSLFVVAMECIPSLRQWNAVPLPQRWNVFVLCNSGKDSTSGARNTFWSRVPATNVALKTSLQVV